MEKDFEKSIIYDNYIPSFVELKNHPEVCNNFGVMFKLLQSNYRFIELYTGNNVFLFSKAIEDGYNPSFEFLDRHAYLKNDFSIMYPLIKRDYRYITKYTGDDVSIFIIALEGGFLPTIEYLENYPFLKEDEEFMTKLYYRDYNYLKKFEGKDKAFMIVIAMKSGYIPTDDEFHFLFNEDFDDVDSIRMSRSRFQHYDEFMMQMIRINPSNFEYYTSRNPEVFLFALDLGYVPTKEELSKAKYRYIFSSKKAMYRLIDLDISFIDIYTGRDENLFNYALEKGYIPTKEKLINNLGKALCKSNVIFQKLLPLDPNIIIYYYGNNEEILNLAYQNGFFPNASIIQEAYKHSLPILSNDRVLLDAISVDPNLVVYYTGINDEVFKKALQNGYKPSLDDFYKHSNVQDSYDLLKEFLLHDQDYKNNPFLKWFFNSNYNYMMGFREFHKIKEFICLKDIYQIYSFEEISKICRYFIVNEENGILYNIYLNIIKNNHLSILDSFIKRIGEINSCNKEYIILLGKIIPRFEEYYYLIKDVLDNWPISEKDKYFLIYILESSVEITDEITSLDELRNYYRKELTIMHNHANNVMGYNINPSIKDVIYRLLFNMRYSEFLTLGIHADNLELLRDSIKDEKLKEELSCYIIFLNFLDELSNLEINKLRNAALRIIDYIKDNDSICTIYSIVGKLKKRIAEIIACELKEKLFDFDTLKQGNYKDIGYKRINNKFRASDTLVHGEDISGRKVDFIELCGVDYVTLVHVMNAYGEGGSIKDFKYPRIIGKSYICLSGIHNENIFDVSDKEKRRNHTVNDVSLIFDKIDVDQFIMESNCDLYSAGCFNSLLVDADARQEFLPIHKLIASAGEDETNEIVLYRENDKGEYLYPKAILIKRQSPTQEEIDAAAYLGIPIVYVNVEAYINKTKNKVTNEEYHPKKEDYYVLKEKLEELKAMLVMKEKGNKKK